MILHGHCPDCGAQLVHDDAGDGLDYCEHCQVWISEWVHDGA